MDIKNVQRRRKLKTAPENIPLPVPLYLHDIQWMEVVCIYVLLLLLQYTYPLAP